MAGSSDVVALEFEYPEDRQYFADLFDFRHPAIKRWEFNKVRKKVLADLTEKYDGKCQLHSHADCNAAEGLEPDHIIPLSTNELNKKLRNMERTGSEKVPAQSFGSNHPRNLTLACRRCNAFKKHRIILTRQKV